MDCSKTLPEKSDVLLFCMDQHLEKRGTRRWSRILSEEHAPVRRLGGAIYSGGLLESFAVLLFFVDQLRKMGLARL